MILPGLCHAADSQSHPSSSLEPHISVLVASWDNIQQCSGDVVLWLEPGQAACKAGTLTPVPSFKAGGWW